MKWEEKTIQELASPADYALATGPFGSAISAKYFVESGVPVIRGKNLSADPSRRIVDDNLVFVSDEKAEKFVRSIARVGDLVFTCWGTINQIGLIDHRASYEEYVVSNKQMKFTPNPLMIDSLFLYYQFSDGKVQQEILNRNVGGTIPGFNLGELRKFQVQVPPLPTQRKIAGILSAYDDLIENNLKRIKLLEEAAQNIYQEWFVHFRFPGHENVEIEADGLPEGWEKRPLQEVTSLIKRGISPKYVGGDGTVVINQKCIRNRMVNLELSRLTDTTKKINPERILQPFDILVNSTGTGTLGRLAQLVHVEEEITVDTHVTIVRADKSVEALYLGRVLEDNEALIKSLGRGSTNQTELSRSDLGGLIQVAIPTAEIQKKFAELISANYELKEQLYIQNQKLKEARAILLPRLMNQTIEV